MVMRVLNRRSSPRTAPGSPNRQDPIKTRQDKTRQNRTGRGELAAGSSQACLEKGASRLSYKKMGEKSDKRDFSKAKTEKLAPQAPANLAASSLKLYGGLWR